MTTFPHFDAPARKAADAADGRREQRDQRRQPCEQSETNGLAFASPMKIIIKRGSHPNTRMTPAALVARDARTCINRAMGSFIRGGAQPQRPAITFGCEIELRRLEMAPYFAR